jgi:hypothetical protein
MLPSCNGVMTVSREYTGETPCGMKFTTLAGVMGGGASSPGFVGHSKFNITQRKFIVGDGGLLRMVWMPKILKDEIKERLDKRGAEMGVPDLSPTRSPTRPWAPPRKRSCPSCRKRDIRPCPWIRSSANDECPRCIRKRQRCRFRIMIGTPVQASKEKQMALTGIQIFKLLPKTNCKECGVPTCLAFAMNLASGKAELDSLPLCVR